MPKRSSAASAASSSGARWLREQPDLLGAAHQHHVERRIIEADLEQLRHEGDAALDGDAPLARLQRAEQKLEQGRLAAPVRAEQREDASPF